MKFILTLGFVLIGCTAPSSTLIRTVKVQAVSCMQPKSDIIFSQDGYCKFVSTDGLKCIYYGLVTTDETIRLCKGVSRAGWEFIRDCDTGAYINCSKEM